MHVRSLMPAAVCLAIFGCGDSDPLGPVLSPTISVTVNSLNPSDIDNGVIDKDENISNGTGNPWGTFMELARDQCGGEPSGFEVLQVSLSLDSQGSSNVSSLEEVLTGSTQVIFRSTQGSDENATQVTVAAGAVSGTFSTLAVTATASSLAALDDRLRGGDFHVAIRGETTRQAGDDFSMNATVSFSVRAFCD